MKLGRYPEAMKDYDRAIQLAPTQPEAYNNRSNIKKEMHDIDGAIADLDRAIELNPQMARAYLNRGLLKISKNDANGCNDLQQAKKLHSAEADQYLKKYCKTN